MSTVTRHLRGVGALESGLIFLVVCTRVRVVVWVELGLIDPCCGEELKVSSSCYAEQGRCTIVKLTYNEDELRNWFVY